MKIKIIILLLTYLYSLNLVSQKKQLGSRWLLSPDIPIRINIINIQENYKGDILPLGNDRLISFGINLLKYAPNHNYFTDISIRALGRNAIVNNAPIKYFTENSGQINLVFNKLFFNVKPYVLDISKPFLGVGISYTYTYNGQLVYFKQYRENYNKLYNKNRLEGLISLGNISDVFNVSKKTPISKFNLIFRIPLFNSSDNFNSNFNNLPSELSDFQKSKSKKYTIEISYSHLIDFRKNRKSKYELYIDSINRFQSNILIKKLFPPMVNNGASQYKNSGNFFFEHNIYNSLDSISNDNSIHFYDIKKKYFQSYSLGYSFHLFSNSNNDYSKQIPEQEILSDAGFRRNLLISIGYRNTIMQAERNFQILDYIQQDLFGRVGVRLNHHPSNYSFILGVIYYKTIDIETYLNHFSTSTPNLKNTAAFIAIGKSNYYIKFDFENQKFKFANTSIKMSLSIGI